MSLFGYFWDPSLAERDTGITCPEKGERIRVLRPDRLRQRVKDFEVFGFAARGESILQGVHQPEYIREVREAPKSGKRFLDRGDTRITSNIFAQALRAASAGCEAIDKIRAGTIERAFCAVRPPGHHANALRAMGFCIFNNAAVAARYAQRTLGIERVLIVDWDNDPGNGTQEIFWEDPTVFVLSLHQANLFPAAGAHQLIGAGAGEGFNRNVPIEPGTDAATYLKIFEQVVGRTVGRHRPEFVIVSAGFDAHAADPQSKIGLHEKDFGKMTRILLDAIEPYTNRRLLSILEGGYNQSALAASVAEHCVALAEMPVALA